MDTGFQDFFYTSADGLRLHARIYGPAETVDLSVVCLPGLTRNARDFHDLALKLSGKAARPRRVIAFDYRGRGGSQRDPDPAHYTVPIETADILEGLEQLGISRAVFIGTSRGGLILHVIAAQRPELIAGAVLNDVGPELGLGGLMQIRDYLSRPQATLRSLDQAAELQRQIHGDAFPALQAPDWRRMAESVYSDEGGRLVADCDPAIATAFAGLDLTQTLPALWEQFAAFGKTPLLVVRGENSQLLTEDILRRMQAAHPGLEAIVVPGQGHPPMLETGDLPDRIGDFIDSHA
jgi:pimeloyl-ACP methyl ester carboxylesterase